MVLFNRVLKWHIILVNLTYYEGGAKNPSKSISMKLVVLASYAQFGVSAGRNDYWALVMAYDPDPIIRET